MIEDWNDWLAEASKREGVTLRPLEPEDLDEVLRIIRLHDTDDFEAARDTLDYYDFDGPLEGTAYFVLEDDPDGQGARPLGVSGYYPDHETRQTYWLGWTYVNPFQQGSGYGSTLLRFLIDTLAELGVRKLYLSTSSLQKYDRAVDFYEEHGFVREACLDDYYAEGEDQLILARTL